MNDDTQQAFGASGYRKDNYNSGNFHWNEDRTPVYCPHGYREDVWSRCDACAIDNLKALLALANHAITELRHVDQVHCEVPGGNFQPHVYERWDALQSDIKAVLA